jgi:hypothetical protein
MASYQHLDALIGEALECADESAREIRELPLAPVDQHLKKVGAAIVALWEVRDALYKVHPDAKRDFVAEYEVDEARYEALLLLQDQALNAERSGQTAEAATLFRKLYDEARFGYFKLCAEAGLFRTSNAHKA